MNNLLGAGCDSLHYWAGGICGVDAVPWLVTVNICSKVTYKTVVTTSWVVAARDEAVGAGVGGATHLVQMVDVMVS